MSDKGSFHSGGFVGGGGASGGDSSGVGASGDVCARLDVLAAAEGGAAAGGVDGLSSRVFASTVGLIRRSGAAACVDVDVARVARGLDALAEVERLSARDGFEDMVVSGTVGVLLSRADVGGRVGGGGEISLEDRLFASTREMIGVGVGVGVDGSVAGPIPFACAAEAGRERAGSRVWGWSGDGWGARLSMAAAVLLTASLTWMMVVQGQGDGGSSDLLAGGGNGGVNGGAAAGGGVTLVAVSDVTFDDLYRFIDDQGALLGVSLRNGGIGSGAVDGSGAGSLDDEWCPLCDWYSPEVEVSL